MFGLLGEMQMILPVFGSVAGWATAGAMRVNMAKRRRMHAKTARALAILVKALGFVVDLGWPVNENCGTRTKGAGTTCVRTIFESTLRVMAWV